jgi:hypothetical protein
LFDDSTLQRRIGFLVSRLSPTKVNVVADASDAEAAASIRSTMQEWYASSLSDDALRVWLWIYLREAFALPPVTFASSRSASTAADDIVVRALRSLQPGQMKRYAQKLGVQNPKEVPTTLDALARKTMGELMTSFFNADDAPTVQARERLLSEMRTRLDQLPPEDQERLMQAAGVDGLNDAALRNILITGVGLSGISVSVSLAGFSAYILAAQASAFIPLVSGPALVSMVAVLSNPITVIAATGGMMWWATRSANQKVRGAVAVRVLSLLALNGLEAGEPPRFLRRLQPLRGWSHEEDINTILSRAARARGTDGAGASGRARIAVGGDCLDRRQGGVHARVAASLGPSGRA